MLLSTQQCTGQAPTADLSGPNVSNAEGENTHMRQCINLVEFCSLTSKQLLPLPLVCLILALLFIILSRRETVVFCFLMTWCVVPSLCKYLVSNRDREPHLSREKPSTGRFPVLHTMQNIFLCCMQMDCGDVQCFLSLCSSFVSSSGLLFLEKESNEIFPIFSPRPPCRMLPPT